MNMQPLHRGHPGELWLTACAWCERVQLDGSWVSDVEAIRMLRTFESEAAPSITHTICPRCFGRLERRRTAQRASPGGDRATA